MPRQSGYSEAEDAIILATAGMSVGETNRRLMEAGYPARSPSQLYNRRHRLKLANPLDAPTVDGSLDQLVLQFQRVDRLIREWEQRAAEARAQRAALARRISELTQQVVAQSPSEDSEAPFSGV